MAVENLLRNWLGIPKTIRDPSYYQLLGLTELEPDPTVIGLVSTYCLKYVKKRHDEQPSQASDQLLTLLKKAQGVLLHPEKKKSYDVTIRGKNPSLLAPPMAEAANYLRIWLGVVVLPGTKPTAHQLLQLDVSERDRAVIKAKYDLRMDCLKSLEEVCTTDEQPRVRELKAILSKALNVAMSYATQPRIERASSRRRHNAIGLKGRASRIWISVGVFLVLLSVTILVERYYHGKKSTEQQQAGLDPVAVGEKAPERAPAEKKPPADLVKQPPADVVTQVEKMPKQEQKTSQSQIIVPPERSAANRAAVDKFLSLKGRHVVVSVENADSIRESDRITLERRINRGTSRIRTVTDISLGTKGPLTPVPDYPIVVNRLILDNVDFLPDEVIESLKDLDYLESCNLVTSPVTDRHLSYFGKKPYLHMLSLKGTNITNVGLESLSGCPYLDYIGLQETAIDDRGLNVLLGFSRELQKIDLDGTGVTDAGIARLVERGLTSISVARTEVTDAGVMELIRCKTLFSLGLEGTKVTEKSLVQLDQLKELSYLNLNYTAATDAVCESIGRLKRLRTLNLAGTQIGSKAIGYLSSCSELVFLTVNKTSVSNEGLELLRKCPNLQILDLSYTKVADEGIEAIIGNNNLRSLSLGGTAVTSAAIPHFSKLPALRTLFLPKAGFNSEDITRLKEALPQCRVTLD